MKCDFVNRCEKDTPFFVVMLFTVILLCFLGGHCAAQHEPHIILKDGSTLNISFLNYNVNSSPGRILDNTTLLLPMSTITINVIEIPSSVKFILLQAHSFLYNVTLSYEKVLTLHSYINGTDIGLIQILSAKQKLAQFVLFNSNANRNATILIAAQGYGKDAPIPGGCNMEFSVEVAPFLNVSYDDAVTRVECQPAATPLGSPGVATRSCEMRHVDLEMYHLYLPEREFTAEAYFDAVRSMMTVNDVQQNGRKVEPTLEGSPMRRVFSSYPGTGSVYSVVAVAGFSGAAYVPAVSYGCDIVYWDDNCQVLTTSFSKVFCAIMFFLGLFICFCGHQYFKSEMFLLGFVAATFVTYILLDQQGSYDATATQGICVISGVFFGFVWLMIWCWCGIPIVSVFLATLCLGLLLSSTIMYAGVGDYQIFDSDFNFWIVFSSMTLTIPILCMTETHKANVLCCGILGAYAVVMPIDHYIGSNLKYILVNTVRRATVREFRTAELDPPFQMRDVILVCVWCGLAALGVTLQLYRARGRPPFPTAPRATPPRHTRVRRARGVPASDRTPLMADARQPYGSTTPGDDSVFVTPSTSERKFTLFPHFPPPTAPPAQTNKELF